MQVCVRPDDFPLILQVANRIRPFSSPWEHHMHRITANVSKILLGAFTLLAITTLYAKPASAARWAIAYDAFGTTCTGNPGSDCD